MDDPDLTPCNCAGEPLSDAEAACALAAALLRAEQVARRLGRWHAAALLKDARGRASQATGGRGSTRH